MGEEAFDSVVLAADTGTLTVVGGYGRKKVWLGIHKGNDPEGEASVGIWLTERQQKELADALERMTFVAIEDMRKRLNVAVDALVKVSMGHAFTDEEQGEKWMRDTAEAALREVEGY